MRAYILTALALLSVSGCDSNSPAPKPATVSCNCTTPAAPPPLVTPALPPATPAIHHRGRHRSASWHGRGYRWHKEYAETSVFTYDYHSDSHSYYQGEPVYRHGGGEEGWVDGYGRSHGSGSEDDSDFLASGDAHGRMKPWHGYDVDCPDDRK